MPSITSVPNPAVNAVRPTEPQPAATTAASSAPAETPGSNGPGLLQSAINAGKGFLYRQLASVPERAMNTASAVINAGAGLYRQAISAPEQVVAGASDLVHARTNSFYSQKAGTPEQALTSAAAMKNYLAWGGDVQARDESGKTLLHRAAFPGKADVLKEVLAHVGKMDEGKRKEILNARTSAETHYALSPLGLAAAAGSMEAVSLLVNTPGVDLNARNKFDMTPLMCAEGHPEIFTALLNTVGVDVKAKCNNGRNVLARSVIDGRIDNIPAILAHPNFDKEDLNAKDNDLDTALHTAILKGHQEAIELLTAAEGIDVLAKNRFEMNPLAWAAAKGRVEGVQAVLKHPDIDKTALNAADKNGDTALHNASLRGHEKVVELLASLDGVNLNARNHLGETPLMAAESNSKIFQALLNTKGVDVKARCKQGYNVLARAVIDGGREDDMKAILKHPDFDKEAVNARGNNGYTALHISVANNRAAAFDVLVGDARTDLNATDKDGLTPVSRATVEGRVELLKKMLENPAFDPDKPTNTKMTPLMLAVRGGKEDCFDVLLASGRVNLNATNEIGFTPLTFAGLFGKWSMFDKLMAHKDVDPNLEVEGFSLLRFVRSYGEQLPVTPGFNVKAADVEELKKRLEAHERVIEQGRQIIGGMHDAMYMDRLKAKDAKDSKETRLYLDRLRAEGATL